MKAPLLVDFIKQLLKDSQCKVNLSEDSMHVHYAQHVRDRFGEIKGQVYLPECNPGEHLICNLKTGVRSISPVPMKFHSKILEMISYILSRFWQMATGEYDTVRLSYIRTTCLIVRD